MLVSGIPKAKQKGKNSLQIQKLLNISTAVDPVLRASVNKNVTGHECITDLNGDHFTTPVLNRASQDSDCPLKRKENGISYFYQP